MVIKILFRADGNNEIGLGHIFRCLTLSKLFKSADILFVTKKNTDIESLLIEKGVNFRAIASDNELMPIIKSWKPNIVVIDCLNSTSEFMINIKKLNPRLISIEDKGDGGKYADAVISALYNDLTPPPNYYIGYKYHCLREEFLSIEPKKFSETVKRILITFGGSDPSNLTDRLYKIAKNIHSIFPGIHFSIICGPGYKPKTDKIITDLKNNIEVLYNINNISFFMNQSDLAISSQGSTIFELASLGIPTITLAQNNREMLHTFAEKKNGFINLGLGSSINDNKIENTIISLINDKKMREEMHDKMLGIDLKNGAKRVAQIILGDKI